LKSLEKMAAAFWENLNQNQFCVELESRLEKELSEGFSSLISHLNPKEKNKIALERLERRSIEFMKSQMLIFKKMCENGVFVEPEEVPRKRPVGFKGTEAELDEEIDELIARVAKVKGECKSLEDRHIVLMASSSIVDNNVSKIKDAVQDVDFEKLAETSRNSKRLRYLVQCANDLKEKFPAVDHSRIVLETALTQERRGMPSTRGLATLDAVLSKVPDE
jgi:hypothetical protein